MTKTKLKFKPDPTELKVEKFLDKSWCIIKKESKRLFNWTFFYKPKGKFDKMLHVVDILALLYIAIRISKGV